MARRPLRKADIACLETFGHGGSDDGNLVARLVFLLMEPDVWKAGEQAGDEAGTLPTQTERG
ncbi:hypothetical protein [Gorillibacterium timonense]|uniref:hypothetical protein n=1 Tax=Gorillibacterium timonense TaxID=1689269 RepID=UPI00071C308B|nr:hypothetical protein [Gorillibacterium timonense]